MGFFCNCCIPAPLFGGGLRASPRNMRRTRPKGRPPLIHISCTVFVAPPPWPRGGSALSERHGKSSPAGLGWRRARQRAAAATGSQRPPHRPRADRPCRPRRGAGAARGACPHAPLAAAALALSLAGGRRAAAGAARPARAAMPSFADEVAAGQLRARRLRSPNCAAARRSRFARRARLGARAARLRLAAPSRGRADRPKPEAMARAARARMDRGAAAAARRMPGRPRSSAAASSPGCRTRALLLEGAERKRYAAVMRSLTDQVTYLSASWRNAPDGYPRLLALIGARPGRSVHRRPRAAARAIAEAAGRRAGAPDPPRRRPHQPQPGDAGRAAARPAAAAPVLRRARRSRPTRRCWRPSPA